MNRDLSTAQTAWYFYRIHHGQDNFFTEFIVVNHNDPDQFVETLSTSGGEIWQRWDKREEGDRLVFRAPDGYIGGEVGWCYNHTRQKGVAAPVEVLDREQLRNRKSLIVNGFKSA